MGNFFDNGSMTMKCPIRNVHEGFARHANDQCLHHSFPSRLIMSSDYVTQVVFDSLLSLRFHFLKNQSNNLYTRCIISPAS